jgi:hypothetical protein
MSVCAPTTSEVQKFCHKEAVAMQIRKGDKKGKQRHGTSRLANAKK